MNKIFFLFSILVLPFLFVPQVLAQSPVSGHKIVIDAGHGGSDFGSTACIDLPEKVANLDIANRLKGLLELGSASVFMTRTDDSTLENRDRYTFANSTGAEVLVSVHLNGSTNTLTDGTQGLFGKIGKDKSFTEVMHSALWEGLKATPNFTDFGVTNFASGLLLKTVMPATIQETVFISSAYECNLLKNSSGTRQQEIAQVLYNGLSNWFNKPQPTPTPRPGKNK